MIRGAVRVTLVVAVAVAGCGRVVVPRVGLPGAGAGNEGAERLLENRIWFLEDGPQGAFSAFLSDGTLIEGECGTPARVAAWRWVDEGVLVWEATEGTRRGEIGLIGPNELVLIADPDGDAAQRSFRTRRRPVPCS